MTAEITPTDVRVGDRIIITTRQEGTVKNINKGKGVKFEDEGHTVAETWELVERAVPPVEFGSKWVDPQTGQAWIAVGAGKYVSDKGWLTWTLDGRQVPELNEVIARLVPAEENPRG